MVSGTESGEFVVATIGLIDALPEIDLIARLRECVPNESVVVQSLDSIDAVDTARHEAVIVDCRHDHGAPAGWRFAIEFLSRLPCVVIAIVAGDDETRSSGSGLDGEAAELVDLLATLEDLCTHRFAIHLEREVRRQRKPFGLLPRWQPERLVLEAMADHSTDWFFLKDLEHRFLLAPESFARAVGRPRESIIGRDDLEIGSSETLVKGDPESGWPGFWAQDDAVTQEGRTTVEENPDWHMFSESPRHKRTVRVPLRGARGEVYALLACASDVTRIMRAESAVVRGRSLLDAESRARRAAEKAASEKMNFLAAATHDLRQPLHAMGLFIESLDRRLDCPQQSATLDKIRQSTNALSALFNSLLDITRLDAALVTAEPADFSMTSLIDSLREEFVVEGALKGLEVTIDPVHEIVHTDPVLLGRILRNLLHNAVRYTDSGRVGLESTMVGDRLECRISDTGPGIPLSEHDAIFGEFYQVGRNPAMSDHGLGLGLAIVRRTASLIGATLSLDSAPGAGSTFSVRIPLGDPSGVRVMVEARLPEFAANRVVLVIDDEAEIRNGMEDIFRANGCAVVVADGIESAFDELADRSLEPDIVIADHRLDRGETGGGVIEAVRKRFDRSIPGVIVTGDTAPERMREASRAGFAFLHKPAAPAELVRVVADLLE